MRAIVYRGPGSVQVETVPDPVIQTSTDAVVQVAYACVCGSDLWFYNGLLPLDEGQVTGHEMLGTIFEIGRDVTSFKPGDTVIVPISFQCGYCSYCREGLVTSCPRGGGFGFEGVPGGQAEAVRVPFADHTLVKVPGDPGCDRSVAVRALLLGDVMSTGYHAAVSAGVMPGHRVVVIGDGSVGLCAVLAALRLGAQQIIAIGHHKVRLELAGRMGATHVVNSAKEDIRSAVLDITEGHGADRVLECVGGPQSFEDALAVVRDGGVIGHVGVPAGSPRVPTTPLFERNIALKGGVTPSLRYIPELLHDAVAGRLDPSPVLDLEVALEATPDAYASMARRESTKALIVLV